MCGPELAPVLTKLFKKCIKESCFPSCWKLPSVVPVFKNNGERSNAGDYRPISLLPVVSKVFEILINSSIIKHLDSNGLLSDHQYGFRSSRSTADLLTVITERIHQTLDSSGESRAIALDISKAFDRVWHAGLLHKLKAYGISGSVLAIIKSFLSNRKIKVVLNGESSSEYAVNSGVPQGSVLGPILFLIFINDLPDDLMCRVGIFADDTTLYSGLPKPSCIFDKVELAADLESDLRAVVEWGDKWLVTFNCTKTKLLSINRYHDPFLPSVNMSGEELPENELIRLLGLYFTNTLDWTPYIESIALSAARKIGSLFRARAYLTPESILYLYKSTIRPCMEYCCHIWAGASCTALRSLDKIQNRLLNLVGPELFSTLDSLSHRRDVASLALFYRYYHGKCSDDLASLIPKSYGSVCAQRERRGSFHKHSVYLPRRKTTTYANSFIPRTSILWNSLSKECFPSDYDLDSFKISVNQFLKHKH